MLKQILALTSGYIPQTRKERLAPRWCGLQVPKNTGLTSVTPKDLLNREQPTTQRQIEASHWLE